MSPKAFEQLKKQWYKKLKKSGFNDIENGEYLKSPSGASRFSSGTRNLDNTGIIAAKTEYYRLAGHFLNDYSFSSSLEYLIWEMHSNGTSHRDMVPKLKSKGYKVYRAKVFTLLKNLKSLMLEKYATRNN